MSDNEILTVPYDSDGGEDDEFQEFNEDRAMEGVKLTIGMKFSNVKSCRTALREYLIMKGFRKVREEQ